MTQREREKVVEAMQLLKTDDGYEDAMHILSKLV